MQRILPSEGQHKPRNKKGIHPCPNFDSKYPNIRIVDVSQQVKLATCNVTYEKVYGIYTKGN